MIVYLVRDIPAFVMYCIYGESRSSLLIESTDSMIPKVLFGHNGMCAFSMLFSDLITKLSSTASILGNLPRSDIS